MNNPPASPGISQAKVGSSTKTEAEAGNNTTGGVASAQGDARVSISKEGRDALAAESGGKLHAQASQAQAQSAEASEKPKSKIDELIEALKEKVEKLKQELKELEGDKSEAGEKKRQALQSEIAVLSAQIADLTNQKLEQEKKDKAKQA